MNILGFDFSQALVAIVILLGLLGLFAAMALFARNYIKVPPSTVAIFFGRKHVFTDEKGQRTTVGFRIVRGGAACADMTANDSATAAPVQRPIPMPPSSSRFVITRRSLAAAPVHYERWWDRGMANGRRTLGGRLSLRN